MGKAENNQLAAAGALRPGGGKEQRKEPRYMVTWRVGVSVGGRGPSYGRAKDISLSGMAVLNDLNLSPGTCLALIIHVPTLSRSCESKALVVQGTVIYTVYDSRFHCFRIGVSFKKFEQPSDRAFLEERLANHHALVPDYICQRSTDRF